MFSHPIIHANLQLLANSCLKNVRKRILESLQSVLELIEKPPEPLNGPISNREVSVEVVLRYITSRMPEVQKEKDCQKV